MTVIKERAVEMIERMPDDRVYYLLHLLEDMEAMLDVPDKNTPGKAQLAFKELQKYRRPRTDVIDVKAELHKAWEEKYASAD